MVRKSMVVEVRGSVGRRVAVAARSRGAPCVSPGSENHAAPGLGLAGRADVEGRKADVLEGRVKDVPKDVPKDALKDDPKDVLRDAPKGVLKDDPKDAPAGGSPPEEGGGQVEKEKVANEDVNEG